MRLYAHRAARVIGMALSAAVLALGGCAHHHAPSQVQAQTPTQLPSGKTVDLLALHWVKVQVKPCDAVVLSTPMIEQVREGGISKLVIEGTVTREPGKDVLVPGHVHILVWSKEGVLLENFALEWKPDDIPIDGTRSSKYRLDYLWTMPRGAIVRILYHDKPDDIPTAGESGASTGYQSGYGNGIGVEDSRIQTIQGPSQQFNANSGYRH